MNKCPICQKQKSEYEMRLLLNVPELQAGKVLSEEKNEREMAGTKVDIVCRSCWEAILKEKTKEEVIEMFETLCGLLFEMEKAAHAIASGRKYLEKKWEAVAPNVVFP